MHQRSHWSLAKLPIRLSLYRGQMTAFFSAIFFETSTTEGQMTGICGKILNIFERERKTFCGLFILQSLEKTCKMPFIHEGTAILNH